MHKRQRETLFVLRRSSEARLVDLFSETYCGGYSGEDPPLPIPNREVKLTIADGTAPPGGRVGSCHFLIRHPVILDDGVFCYARIEDFSPQYSEFVCHLADFFIVL